MAEDNRAGCAIYRYWSLLTISASAYRELSRYTNHSDCRRNEYGDLRTSDPSDHEKSPWSFRLFILPGS